MKPTPRHWPQYFGAFFVIVLLAGVASASGALLTVKDTTDSFLKLTPGISKEAAGALDHVPPGKPQTLLLIGSDKRSKKAADGGRTGELSDTLMLARLDPQQGATAVMSIPRDTKAQIPLKGGGFRTGKINEAFADGGELFSIRAVRKLLDLPIHHVVVINFNAFQRAVNKLGCLYQDVDRTYFNDNLQGGEKYATIDVKAGYQLLCGADTLDWVRFRHTDSDFIRAARQQEFLRSAKSQVAASRIVRERKELLRIFGLYTRTDIQSTSAILSLLKLAVDSADQPVRSVKFQAITSADASDTYVTFSDAGLAKMRTEFTQLKETPGPKADTTEIEKARKKSTKRAVKKKGLAAGLIRTPADISKPELVKSSFELAGSLPVYFPAVRLGKGGYTQVDGVRDYKLKLGRFSKRTAPAYRLSLFAGDNGQYYGVQGTTWKDAPILKDKSYPAKRNGRTLRVYPDGNSYRLVAWKTANGVYWVSNTVSGTLTKAQMLDIAANLKRVPG